MARRALLALALLVLPSGVAAAPERVVDVAWTYTLSLPDPESGNVRVDIGLSGAEGAITRFTFVTGSHREPITNVTGGPTTLLDIDPLVGTVAFDVDGDESFSFDVAMERAAFKPGETLAHVGADFALFKAESAALAYSYRFYEGVVVRNVTTVRLVPPAGWQEAAPWRSIGKGEYALAGSEAAPRGFVVMGPFRKVTDIPVDGRVFRHVQLGAEPTFTPDLRAYFEGATPYYRAVYGRSPAYVLIVSAPDPMFRGGLGATDSLYVHETADLRTLAHEYAHVHQRFGTEERVGLSSMWLAEGDADWHGALSLHAADLWSPMQVQRSFDEAAADARVPSFRDERLADVSYGMMTPDGRSLERFAYHKGSIVLRALDEELAQRGGVAEMLRRLNARHGDPTNEAGVEPVGNQEAREVAEEVAGRDLDAFFAKYVHGTEWPTPPAFRPEGELVVEGLALTPSRASPGERVRATVVLANQGTAPVERDVPLLLDGATVGTRRVALEVGGSATLEYGLVAGPPGDHDVRVLYERAVLHSLLPADLKVTGVSLLPTRPAAGSTARLLVFVENAGEEAGVAHVEAREGLRTLAATPEHLVEPGETDVLTLPIAFNAEGPVTLDVVLFAGGRESRVPFSLDVDPPDADGDGVPDVDDAYPRNPALSHKSVANDARDVPGAPLAALVVGLGALAMALRGKAR